MLPFVHAGRAGATRFIPGRSSLMSPTAVAAGSAGPMFDADCRIPVPDAGDADDAVADRSSRSNTTSTEWTGTTPPTSPRVSTIRPERGDVIVTVALSVITSTIGWSSATTSPGDTSQVT